MIQIGQAVMFNPLEGMLWYGAKTYNRNVAGVITAIHTAHRWFLVEYGKGANKLRIGFKFDDVGKSVSFIKK
jgi:hypothetical protein